jgi:hypothetical protein
MSSDVQTIANIFAIGGTIESVADFGSGNINDSYLVTCHQGLSTVRYLLQRINDLVFRKPVEVMENITRVTEHTTTVLYNSGVSAVDRRTLTIVPTREGRDFYNGPDEVCWRMYHYIEGTLTRENATTPHQAHQAAQAIGTLQTLLISLPEPPLHETIPHFHDTPLRYRQLEEAVRENPFDRLAQVKREVDFADSNREFSGLLQDLRARGELPLRTVHNDAKISNVLFDRDTDQAICVVDLDTIMPGLALDDFGDMVRTMDVTAPEDEADLSQVEISLPLFEGLASGYVSAAESFLTPCERKHLVASGQILTLEQGVRFLTDFLLGDAYYKTSRPNHNLDRCRNQFKLLRSLMANESTMRRFVETL